MAGDGAGIADAGAVAGVGCVGGRWVAGETGEDALLEGSEVFGAMLDALWC